MIDALIRTENMRVCMFRSEWHRNKKKDEYTVDQIKFEAWLK